MSGKYVRGSAFCAWLMVGVCAALALCSCGVRPKEAAEAFLTALADKDLRRAGNLCSPELRSRLTNFPSAARAFMYGVEQFDWRVHDMGPTRDGGMAVVARVLVKRQWPAPPAQEAVLRIDLYERDGRWRVTGGTVAIENYTELVTNPVEGLRAALPQMGAPRWPRTINVNESLPAFVRRYDAYCASWVR
jgi:hypothetical protein